MTQQTRMLLVLGVFGFGGTIALLVMATRYGKILEEHVETRPPSVATAGRDPVAGSVSLGVAGRESVVGATWTEALRQVDAFIEVRGALADAVRSHGPAAAEPDVGALAGLRERRDRAADRAGLALADYVEVLERFRAWKSDRRIVAPDLLDRALDLRRAQLEPLDLGPYERTDL